MDCLPNLDCVPDHSGDEVLTKNNIVDMAQARPTRKLVENPLTWWQGTPWLLWNKDYGGTFGIWAGAGEAEALGELFFDNLATMLSVTDLMLGFFLNVLVFNAASDVNDEYAKAISDRYTTLYYERCIPGVSVGLLFGNFYYGHMAGRLAHKENRQDVTAQPYGINTTGAYITLGAINLEALMAQVFNEDNLKKVGDGKPGEAGVQAANKAFAIAVAANFVTGLFEIVGCAFAEPIRAIIPPPAYYSLLTGVGFVYLAFANMLLIAAEPIVCLVPLLIVVCGFFGGVKYKVGSTGVTVPIAVVAIASSVIIGWAGGCRHKHGSVEMYNYGDSWKEIADKQDGIPFFGRRSGSSGNRRMYFDSRKWATCPGTSKHDASYAYRTYAGDMSAWGGGIFTDVGDGMSEIGVYLGLILVVAVVGFAASLAGVESAAAAGDDYPMAETLVIDGVGTCLGAIFGSFYGTTVYIGHPIHKTLGARRGYSILNGVIFFIFLTSGMFATIYNVIPGCANGALLIFVGLLVCRQAVEDNPPDYYPAIFFGLFPCICNWCKLRIEPGVTWNNYGLAWVNDDFIMSKYGEGGTSAGPGKWWDTADAGNWGAVGMGIHFMGQGGGEWFTLILTSIFCYCTDRNFKAGAVICALATFLQLLTGIPTVFNAKTYANDGTPKLGPERLGYYPKKNEDTNFSWAWAVAFAMATGFFLVHFALQRAGYIDPPIVRARPGPGLHQPGGAAQATEAATRSDLVAGAKAMRRRGDDPPEALGAMPCPPLAAAGLLTKFSPVARNEPPPPG